MGSGAATGAVSVTAVDRRLTGPRTRRRVTLPRLRGPRAPTRHTCARPRLPTPPTVSLKVCVYDAYTRRGECVPRDIHAVERIRVRAPNANKVQLFGNDKKKKKTNVIIVISSSRKR